MNFGGSSRHRGRRVLPGRLAGWALCVLALVPATLAAQSPTPAGTAIGSWARVTFQDPSGLVGTAVSDTVFSTVGQVAGLDLEPPRASIADPSDTVVYQHTLANLGNGTDSMIVTVTLPSGWPTRTYVDVNRNGIPDPSDAEVTGPVILAMADTASLLVAVEVPQFAAVRGTCDTIQVRVTSLVDGSIADAVSNVLDVRDVGIVVSLSKSVDRPTATIGEILNYTITYSASGPSSAANFTIQDLIPLRTSYVPGTLRLNGTPLTDVVGDDAGRFEGGGHRVVFTIGDITGGDTGVVSFQVRIDG